MKVLWVNNESSEHPWIYYQFVVSHTHSHQNPFPKFTLPLQFLGGPHPWFGFPGGSVVKNLPAMWVTWVQS